MRVWEVLHNVIDVRLEEGSVDDTLSIFPNIHILNFYGLF